MLDVCSVILVGVISSGPSRGEFFDLTMSCMHDGHQSFFHFSNPFRKILPNGSHIPPKFQALLKSFEEDLAKRLDKLKPKDSSSVLSLSWMQLGIESLSETHTNVKSLITDLEFPTSDWDEKWMDAYLDDSVKLLDICISLSSEISRLNQAQLLLQYAFNILDSSADIPSPDRLSVAHDSIIDWMQQTGSRGLSSCSPKNPMVETCLDILHGLADPLSFVKVKTSSRGKVLLQAMYGVKAQTVFICSVFMAAFSGSPKSLIDLQVPLKFLWSATFMDLQATVNDEIRRLFGNGSLTVLKELEMVDGCAISLLSPIQTAPASSSIDEATVLKERVRDLSNNTEKLSQGLDLLSKKVDGFFHIVLSGRDALLCNLRVSTDSLEISCNEEDSLYSC